MEARESLNGRENMARRKVKNGDKNPLGTMSYQTSSKRSPPFWLLIGARKLLCFSAQSEARMAATVWNWPLKTLSPGVLLAVLYYSSCRIFPPVQTFRRPHYLPLGLRGCFFLTKKKKNQYLSMQTAKQHIFFRSSRKRQPSSEKLGARGKIQTGRGR